MGSGFRAPETPSKGAGPREPWQPSPGSPYGERGAGCENACIVFSIRGALGLWLAARGEFPFTECSCQKLVWGRRCDGPSALSGRAGSGGMDGAWAQRASRAQSCFPTKENPWGVGFGHRRSPAKQQGPRSQGRPAGFAIWRAGGRARKRPALLSRSEARWGCGLLPEESFPLQVAAARSSFMAVDSKEPRR